MADAVDIAAEAREFYERKETDLGSATRRVDLQSVLRILDNAWQAHLQAMADLLPAIKARSRDGRASLVDYRREAGLLLDSMRDQVRRDLVKAVLSLREHRPDGET